MSINFTAVQTALNTQLATVSGVSSMLEVENTKKKTTIGTPFVRATLLPAQTQPATLGQGGYDGLNGLYQVDVCYPQDDGTLTAGAMADLIINAFVKGTYYGSTPKVLVQNRWRLPSRRLGSFFVIPVVIQWVSYQQ